MIEGMFNVTDRICVVTGAGRGLGACIATGLMREGAVVALLGRHRETLESTLAAAQGLPGQSASAAIVCDVSDEESVMDAATILRTKYGHVDALINNAGATWGADISAISRSSWDAVLATNLTGAMQCSRHFRELMSSGGGGSIAMISSSTALRGLPFMNAAAYTSSKAALEQFTREAASAWARDNIRVNTLRLGFFSSQMTEPFLSVGNNREVALGLIPLGRVGECDDLVGPVLYLISDASRYVTGAVITIDGGMASHMGPLP